MPPKLTAEEIRALEEPYSPHRVVGFSQELSREVLSSKLLTR
jgi:hypothetical protein